MGIVRAGREERGRLRLRPKCRAAEELWSDDIAHSVSGHSSAVQPA